VHDKKCGRPAELLQIEVAAQQSRKQQDDNQRLHPLLASFSDVA
jgi:hypothetical protein